MLFSIILLILVICIFFWVLKLCKQDRYEYELFNNANNAINANNVTTNQIKAAAQVVAGVLKLDKQTIEDKLIDAKNAGKDILATFKNIITTKNK